MQHDPTHSEPLLCGRQVYNATSFHQQTLAHEDEQEGAQNIDNLPKVMWLVKDRGHRDPELSNTKAVFPLLQPCATVKGPSVWGGAGSTHLGLGRCGLHLVSLSAQTPTSVWFPGLFLDCHVISVPLGEPWRICKGKKQSRNLLLALTLNLLLWRPSCKVFLPL